MARAGGLDRAGGTDSVSSTEKVKVEHGSNEPNDSDRCTREHILFYQYKRDLIISVENTCSYKPQSQGQLTKVS